MTSIFLSHDHEDKQFVRRLDSDLKNAGVRVWVDEAEMRIGDDIKKKINYGLNNSEYFGIIISSHSVASEWVDYELNLAASSRKKREKILPIRIDNCPLPKKLEEMGILNVDASDDLSYTKSITNILRKIGVISSEETNLYQRFLFGLFPCFIIICAEVPIRIILRKDFDLELIISYASVSLLLSMLPAIGSIFIAKRFNSYNSIFIISILFGIGWYLFSAITPAVRPEKPLPGRQPVTDHMDAKLESRCGSKIQPDIELFWGKNYTNGSIQFTGRNVSYVGDVWNDNIRSVKVYSGTWRLYKDADFNQRQDGEPIQGYIDLPIGSYSDITTTPSESRMTGQNSYFALSSLRPVSCDPVPDW
jgi:uncharacterized protein with PQ loop repeat